MILDTSEVAAQRAAKAADENIAHYSGLVTEAKLAEAEAAIAALRNTLAEERSFAATVAEELQTTTGLYWRLRSDYAIARRRANDAEADYTGSLASASRLLADYHLRAEEAEAELARQTKRAEEAERKAEEAERKAASNELAAKAYKACYGYASRDRAILVNRLAEAEAKADARAEELTEELAEERSEARRLARLRYEELEEERAANHAVIGSLIHSEEEYKRAAEEAEERAERAEERAQKAARITAEALADYGIAEEPPASEAARYYVVLEDTDLDRCSRSGTAFYQWAYSSLDKAEAKIEAEAEADSAIQLLYLARIIRYGPALDS